MHRVLKDGGFAVSFYGWNKVDLFMEALKAAGFCVVGHIVFPKQYASSAKFLRYQHEQAYLLAISGFPSDRDDLTADLDLRFEGAEDILRSWRKCMRPDPDLTASEWADAHRWLSSRGAAEPGRYRTARAPYLREIMDALSPRHPAQRVSFMKAAQVGATEAGNNWIGFVIHHAPGPMLAVLPTVEMAKRLHFGRLRFAGVKLHGVGSDADGSIEFAHLPFWQLDPAQHVHRSRHAGSAALCHVFRLLPGHVVLVHGTLRPARCQSHAGCAG